MTMNDTMMKNVELTETEQETDTQTSAVADTSDASAQGSTSTTSASEEKKKSKKTRKTVECRVDHEERTLIVTKKTSIPGSPAFKELMQQRALYPDYTIVYRTAKSSENRLSVKGLTIETMEKFIELNYADDKRRMAEFQLQKQLSDLYPVPINYLRNWFRRNCREYWENAKQNKKSA